MLGVAYLYSLNLCCFFFLFNFSFSRSRAFIAVVPALFHRVWMMVGARYLGNVDPIVGLEVADADRVSLAREAMH